MPERRLSPFNFIGLVAGILFAVFPIFWMVSTSFKVRSEWVTSPPTWISSRPTVDNYLTILAPHVLLERRGGTQQVGNEDFGGSKDDAAGGAIADFLNRSAWPGIKGTVIISISATILSIAVGLMAAISISRYRFGGNFTPFFILTGRMFPPIAIAIPFVIMFSNLPSWMVLTDTYIGLILAYAAVTVPFSTWMLKSFVDELPQEIEEAAMMDGLSRWGAHLKVTVPLIKGGIIATTLFILILNWSEFLFALVLTYTKVQTIPVQLSKYFSATEGTLYGVQAALAMVSIIPLVIIGFFIQKHLVRGLTLGAIKR
jgi:multiple sugar transport system permease protein